MTTEEKELLLKDLCARLPYCVIMGNKTLLNTHYVLRGADIDGAEFDDEFDDVPYLRPMSRMTKKEVNELKNISTEYLDEWVSAETSLDRWELDAKSSAKRANFYCSHHLDWNGLIKKGLALEATEDMYKTE